MDSSWYPILGVVLAFVGLSVFKRLGQIAPGEAKRLVQEGARLVDVRSAGEFASGHLPGAVNIPLQELGQAQSRLGPKANPVVVYCASGARSAVARSQLIAGGFSKVFNLGSMARW